MTCISTHTLSALESEPTVRRAAGPLCRCPMLVDDVTLPGMKRGREKKRKRKEEKAFRPPHTLVTVPRGEKSNEAEEGRKEENEEKVWKVTQVDFLSPSFPLFSSTAFISDVNAGMPNLSLFHEARRGSSEGDCDLQFASWSCHVLCDTVLQGLAKLKYNVFLDK